MKKLFILVVGVLVSACASVPTAQVYQEKDACKVQVQSSKRCYTVDRFDVEDMQRAFDRR